MTYSPFIKGRVTFLFRIWHLTVNCLHAHTTVNHIHREPFPFLAWSILENPARQHVSPLFPLMTTGCPSIISLPPSFPPPSYAWDNHQQQEHRFMLPGHVLVNFTFINIKAINIILIIFYMKLLISSEIMYMYKIWESMLKSNFESSYATYNLSLTIIWKFIMFQN